jgi:hypothetical protein
MLVTQNSQIELHELGQVYINLDYYQPLEWEVKLFMFILNMNAMNLDEYRNYYRLM